MESLQSLPEDVLGVHFGDEHLLEILVKSAQAIVTEHKGDDSIQVAQTFAEKSKKFPGSKEMNTISRWFRLLVEQLTKSHLKPGSNHYLVLNVVSAKGKATGMRPKPISHAKGSIISTCRAGNLRMIVSDNIVLETKIAPLDFVVMPQRIKSWELIFDEQDAVGYVISWRWVMDA